jgi:chromosomal replication initiator protein
MNKRKAIIEGLPEDLEQRVNVIVKNRVRQLMLKEKKKLGDIAGVRRREIEESGMFEVIRRATEVAAQVMDTTVGEMVSPSRYRNAADARMFVYHYARSRTRMTTSSIGAWFNRDHATVIHGAKKMGELIEVDKKTASLYNEFLNKIDRQHHEVNNISQRANDYTSGKVDVLVHRVID